MLATRSLSIFLGQDPFDLRPLHVKNPHQPDDISYLPAVGEDPAYLLAIIKSRKIISEGSCVVIDLESSCVQELVDGIRLVDSEPQLVKSSTSRLDRFTLVLYGRSLLFLILSGLLRGARKEETS